LWALSSLLPAPGWGGDEGAVGLAAACPGAAAWNEAHPEETLEAVTERDQTRAFSDPELRDQLRTRFTADQRARRELLAAPRDPTIRRRVEAIDADNLLWLEKLMQTRGIPTAAEVGASGVRWAWLLVQHADRDPRLQAAAQPSFVERHESGDLPAEYLAKMTDRILLAEGKPQRFGTQFDWLSGKFNPKNAGDLAAIDARRNEIGLMPLADYACMMNFKLKVARAGERIP
jgi:hypothetical protein